METIQEYLAQADVLRKAAATEMSNGDTKSAADMLEMARELVEKAERLCAAEPKVPG
jgi:hypothetical protein